jgi:hypothetical protein
MDSSYFQLDMVIPKVFERKVTAAISLSTIALDWQKSNLSVIISSLSKDFANIQCEAVAVPAL